ncbi:MAG: hypothetical protein QOG54_1675 [Actinomycetota bacterium]|jgi:hypothetical protein|nr:hypothetical protein [Actinomycetota bacterium]
MPSARTTPWSLLARTARRASLLKPPSDREKALEARFREELAALADDPRVPVGPYWFDALEQLRMHVQKDDLRGFLAWPIIQDAMVVGDTRHVEGHLLALKEDPDWEGRWRAAIEESLCGRPIRYRRYWRSSANLIAHAFHVMRFEACTKTRVHEYDRVIELGGGYGSMCRLFHRLGFKGTYTIFDLPHFSVLQRYFLDCVLGGRADPPDINLVSTLAGIEPTDRSTGKSLLIATWSLSEFPIELRTPTLDSVGPTDAYLLGYQDSFEGTDNVAFFSEVRDRAPDLAWTEEAIAYLPKNRYLFGIRTPASG